MVKRMTHEEYVEALSEINPDIRVMGTYVNAKAPLNFRCKVCGHEWNVAAYNLLRGTGCPACNRIKRAKSHDKFLSEIARRNSRIEVIGEYINNKTKIRCRCRICGYEWKTVPSVLLKGHGCPSCAGNAPKGDD